MAIEKLTLLNKKKFIKDMYRYAKDQNDLKYIPNEIGGVIEKFKLDLSYYTGYIAKRIEDGYKNVRQGDKITIQMFDKSESYLNEEINFPFLVDVVTENRIKLKYLS